jgi:hypothetical protein
MTERCRDANAILARAYGTAAPHTYALISDGAAAAQLRTDMVRKRLDADSGEASHWGWTSRV